MRPNFFFNIGTALQVSRLGGKYFYETVGSVNVYGKLFPWLSVGGCINYIHRISDSDHAADKGITGDIGCNVKIGDHWFLGEVLINPLRGYLKAKK